MQPQMTGLLSVNMNENWPDQMNSTASFTDPFLFLCYFFFPVKLKRLRLTEENRKCFVANG